MAMISMEVKGPGQYLMKALNTVEIEGEEKPALIAETLVMLYERRKKKVVATVAIAQQAVGSP